MADKQIKSLSIGGLEIPFGGSTTITAGSTPTATVIGTGEAKGEYSIASGTNDLDLVKDLVWPTSSAEPVEAQPAQALGASSYAHGAGTVAYTTNSVVMGVNASAGAKGFYWYDYEEMLDDEVAIPLGNISSDRPSEKYYVTQDMLDYGLLVTGTFSQNDFELYTKSAVLISQFEDSASDYSSIEEYVDSSKLLGMGITVGDELMVYSGVYSIDLSVIVPVTNTYTVRLSLTQPRISYNPDEIGELLDDGTYKQERTWSSEAQTLLEKWNPINGDYAVISFYGGHKHTNCSKVLAVQDDGCIIVDSLPDPWQSGEVTMIQWDEYLIFCPARPEAGIIEAGLNGFAIGQETAASGQSSFAQGYGSHAAGSYAVATGIDTEAGYAATSAGSGTKATGLFSYAGGLNSQATADQSFAMGHLATATGESSAALNSRTTASGAYATAMGRYTTAAGSAQVVHGRRNIVDTEIDSSGYGKYLHIIGNSKGSSPSNAYTLDWSGNGWFAGDIRIGGTNYTTATKIATVDDIVQSNWLTTDTASKAYIKNKPAIKLGTVFDTDGNDITASYPSIMESNAASASGKWSHAQNNATTASGPYSHAEGHTCVASGDQSHAEGHKSKAIGKTSHAQNRQTNALADYSHAEGGFTYATVDYQHVQGKYNIITDIEKDKDGNIISCNAGNYAHVIGNGSGEDVYNNDGTLKTRKRSNAYTLDWSGNAWFAGTISCADEGTAALTLIDENNNETTLRVVISKGE